MRLCEGGEIEAQMFKLTQMFNRIPNVQISTEAPLLQNRCYRLAFFSVVGYNHFYVVRLYHLSSAFLSCLRVWCFIYFEALEKIF
jgi:hypothetical protein